jgi:hypothetical protein
MYLQKHYQREATGTGVLIFAYNRPASLRKLVASILASSGYQNFDYHLICDGPRNDEDINAIADIGSFIRGCRLNFTSTTYNRVNVGLKQNIYASVSFFFQSYRQLIVLEDDLVLHSHALLYFSVALSAFRGNPLVSQISGFLPPVKSPLYRPFFAHATTSWGWATWDYAWSGFTLESDLRLARLNRAKLRRKYDHCNSYPFSYVTFLEHNGLISSWAIRWYAYNYWKGRLTLYPPFPMTFNCGISGKRTHGSMQLQRQYDGRMSTAFNALNYEYASMSLNSIAVASSSSDYRYYFSPSSAILSLIFLIRWKMRYIVLFCARVKRQLACAR